MKTAGTLYNDDMLLENIPFITPRLCATMRMDYKNFTSGKYSEIKNSIFRPCPTMLMHTLPTLMM